MLKNYLTIAYRNFRRNKFYSVLNISGLAFGMACCLVIGIYVWDEYQYDTFTPEGNRIYRLYNKRSAEGNISYLPIVPPAYQSIIQASFPEAEQIVRLMNIYGKILFRIGEESFYEEKGIFAEADFLDMFSLPLRSGDVRTALQQSNSIVLTPAQAQKYFGDENPVGKLLDLSGDEFKVTGVLETLPAHFHLDIHFIISFATLENMVPSERMESWAWQQFFTYVKLKESVSAQVFEAKLQDMIREKAWPQTETAGFTYLPHLQPLSEIYLYSANFDWDIAKKGNILYVRALLVTAIFMLLIACINFVNLSTAQAIRRAKEVGVRKVSGAVRTQLIYQFIGETILLAWVAMAVGGLMTYLGLPYLNDFTGKSLSFQFFLQPDLLLVLIILIGMVGVVAGVYPAFVMSGYQPVRILRGQGSSGGQKGVTLRKGLVVVQFALSVMLILATLMVFRQMDYLQNKDLGFRKEQVVVLPLQGNMAEQYETVKNELLQHPNIVMASAGYGLPGELVAGDDIILPQTDETRPANVFTIDHDYIKTLGMKVMAGRDFSTAYSTDAHEAFIINETAVRELGFGSPEKAVGQELHWNMWGRDSVKVGQIIGVVQDFHFKSLREKVTTAVLHIYPSTFANLALRIKPQEIPQTLEFIRSTWQRLAPDWPLDYHFLDENFQQLYTSESKLKTLLSFFTVLTLLVASLGLFGLGAYTVNQRSKEIGIRKVLGASVSSIVLLLSSDFTKLVLLSVVVATPIAYGVIQSWLQDFAYRTNIETGVFLLAGGLAILISWLTVSYQSIKAALANPVDALRSE